MSFTHYDSKAVKHEKWYIPMACCFNCGSENLTYQWYVVHNINNNYIPTFSTNWRYVGLNSNDNDMIDDNDN